MTHHKDTDISNRHSLIINFPLTIFLVTLTIVFLGISSTVYITKTARDKAAMNLHLDSMNAASTVEHAFRSIELVLATASEHVTATDQLTGLRPYLQALTARLPTLRTVTVVNPDGIIRSDWRLDEPAKGFDVSDRDYFTAHKKTDAEDGYYYSPPLRSRLDNLTQITISRATRYPDGALMAVIVASLDDRFFSGLSAGIQNAGIYTADIVYRDGRRVYRLGSVAESNFYRRLQSILPGGLSDYLTLDQHIPIPHSDLSLRFSRPPATYMSEALQRSLAVLAISGIMAGLILMIGYFRWRHRLRLDSLDARNRHLSLQLRQLYETVPDAIITIAPDLTILEINAAGETMLGWPRTQAIGMSIDAVLSPEQRQAVRRRIHAFLSDRAQGLRHLEGRTIKLRNRYGAAIRVNASLLRVEREDGPAAIAILRNLFEIEEKNRQLVQLSRDLEAQSRRAEDASRAKSKFLATMSHELRTPLNAIIGFSDLIKSRAFGPLDPPQYGEYIDHIHSSGQHLLSLITNLLELSQFEKDQINLPCGSIDVREAVRQALRRIHATPDRHQRRLRVRVPHALPVVWGNERAVNQILLNLLSNALRFSPEGGRILIDCQQDAQARIRISVQDQGPGIPLEKLAQLGKPFHSLEPGRQYLANDISMGLGLSISTRLAQAMGGDLIIESVVGAGTSVTLVLSPATAYTPSETHRREHT